MHSFVIMIMRKMKHCSVGSKLRAEMKQQRWGLSSSGWCLMLPDAVLPCRCLGKVVPQPTLSVSSSSFCPRQPAGQDPSGQSTSQSDQSHISSAWIIIVFLLSSVFFFRLLCQKQRSVNHLRKTWTNLKFSDQIPSKSSSTLETGTGRK